MDNVTSVNSLDGSLDLDDIFTFDLVFNSQKPNMVRGSYLETLFAVTDGFWRSSS